MSNGNLKNIYMLYYIREIYSPIEKEVTKILGIFSSERKAMVAQECFQNKYKITPSDTQYFLIEKYTTNKDLNFTDGFISWSEANK